MFFGDLAPTGFGSVTTDLGRELLALGADVRFVSQNDTGKDLPEPFRSRTVDLVSLPWTVNEMTGEAGTIGPAEGIPALMAGTSMASLLDGSSATGWVPEAAIVLGDFVAARHIVGRFVEAFKSVPTYHYCPVEGVDLPPLWKELWDIIAPVAMSQFGADQIAAVIGHRPPVVYHGIDTAIFRPVSRLKPLTYSDPPTILQSKDDCKMAWVAHLMEVNGLERIPKRWLLRTDRHMPRKRYNAMIRALAPVLARHPDWALVMHCNPLDQGGYLLDTISKYPTLKGQLLLTHVPGIPRETLNILYNAADLYVSNSAEGFGLTIAEAIACGVPAVGCDYSAVPEVIGPAGKVVTSYLLDNEYDHYWCAVDEQDFARTVEYLMTHQTKREDLGRKGPAHVTANFRWDAAARDFLDIIHSTATAGVAA